MNRCFLRFGQPGAGLAKTPSMERLLLALLLSFSSSIALAALYDVGKVPAHLKPSGFERGRAAALEIPAANDDQGCSATIVSNQGHVLTALHCLPQCIRLTEGKTVSSFRYTVPDHQAVKAGKATCRVPFAQEGRNLGSHSVTVVAVGAGYVYAVKPKNLAKELDKKPERRAAFSQLIEAGVGIPGDFAILSVPGLAGRSCVRTSGRTASVNESVWNIGYPDTRNRAAFSPGSVTYAPIGKVPSQVISGQQGASLVTRRTGALISTIEAHAGSSGSGMLSSQGELLGVVNAAGGNSYASSITNIVSSASAMYGVGVVSQAFNCQ